jgi:putative OPT family oligopeptide transporter
VLNLLAQAYGIGVPSEAHPSPLLAPQATLMAAVAKGVFGGELPWTMIGIGAAIGAVVIVIDSILKAKGANFRVPVLACAIGIYLPIELMVPIFLGGLLSHVVSRRYKHDSNPATAERAQRMGTLFAAGLITGEALMGIFIAIPIVAAGRADVLALPADMQLGRGFGLILLAIIAWLLYRTAVKVRPAT